MPDNCNKWSALTKGFIYNDIYTVLFRIFKISYLRSKGMNLESEKDDSITAEHKSAHKEHLGTLFGLLNKFDSVDKTLGPRITAF